MSIVEEVKALRSFCNEHKDSGLSRDELMEVHKIFKDNPFSKPAEYIEEYKKFLDNNKDGNLSREQLLEVFKSYNKIKSEFKRNNDNEDDDLRSLEKNFNKGVPLSESLNNYRENLLKEIKIANDGMITFQIQQWERAIMNRLRDHEIDLPGDR